MAEAYQGRWVGLIVSSAVLNIGYHLWSVLTTPRPASPSLSTACQLSPACVSVCECA
jgi:hypothetical protein